MNSSNELIIAALRSLESKARDALSYLVNSKTVPIYTSRTQSGFTTNPIRSIYKWQRMIFFAQSHLFRLVQIIWYTLTDGDNVAQTQGHNISTVFDAEIVKTTKSSDKCRYALESTQERTTKYIPPLHKNTKSTLDKNTKLTTIIVLVIFNTRTGIFNQSCHLDRLHVHVVSNKNVSW